MILILLMYALFASSFPISKLLLCYTTPLFLVASRMMIAGFLLLCYQYFYARDLFVFKKKHIWLYVQFIVIGIYFGYMFRFWALNYLDSSKVCFLYNLSPFFAALYSYIFFNEVISKRQWIGLFVGFLGFIPILLSGSSLEQLVGQISFISLPELSCIISVATTSYGWTVMRKLVRDKSYSPTMVNGISMFIGGIMAMVTSLYVDGPLPVTNGYKFIVLLLTIITISNIICHNMYAHLLKSHTATFLSFAGFLSPIFAACYGWLLLHEQPTWHFYVSTIIVFAGLYMFYKDEFKIKKVQEEPSA